MSPHAPPALSALRHLSTASLVAEWSRLFGGPPSLSTCREFLLYTLAWQRQAAQHGGLSLAAQRQLQAVIKANPSSRAQRKPRLAVGTTLCKTWQGQPYTVTVSAEGYQFQGQTYPSLSEIARLITGTRWNGPAFFGLRRTTTAQVKAKERQV
jgi:DUF2924 family protein